LEEYTYLPQIKVESFIDPDINMQNVRTFLDAINPKVKTFLFQIIVGEFKDEVEIEDKHALHIKLDVTPNVDSNQTTFLPQADLDDYETIDNEALNMDSDGIALQESVAVEVYSFGSLIDSFNA